MRARIQVYMKDVNVNERGVMKKIIGLLSIMIILLAGCGSSSEDASTTGFTMVTTSGESENYATQKAVDRYKEETGVEIEVVEVSNTDLVTKVNNMIAAGDTPAIVRSTNWTPFADYIVPLNDIISEDEIVPAALGLVQTPNESQINSIPVDLTGVGLIANVDLLEANGIELPDDNDPWTWEEFDDILYSLKGAEGVSYPLVVDKSSQRLETMIRQFGGAAYSKDGNSITLNSPESVAAITNFVNLVNDDIIPESTWLGSEDSQSMFKAGEVPFHWAGNWVYADYAESVDFNFASVPLPVGEKRCTITGGGQMMVLDTEANEQALDFIEWFIDPVNYAQFVADGSFLPGLTTVEPEYDDPEMQAFFDTIINDINESDIDAISNGFNVEELQGVDTGNILRDNVVQAIQGNITVEEAVEKSANEYSDLVGIPLA